MGKDYYGTLGVSPDASYPDIAKSFRVLAITYHPLKNPENMAQANYKFCEICEAFEVLSTRKWHFLATMSQVRWVKMGRMEAYAVTVNENVTCCETFFVNFTEKLDLSH